MSAKTSTRRPGRYAAIGAVLWLWLAHMASADPRETQQAYISPAEAAAALATAARSHNQVALRAILGVDSEKLLLSGDHYADEEQQRRFAEAYDEKHTLVPDGPERMRLTVGNNDWKLPISIVEKGRWHRWRFDTKAGADEMVNSRISRNEQAAIRVALSYVDAQKDYFDRMKQQTGTGSYAESLISRPARQDGLYWPATADAVQSPLGHLVAQAREEGYPGAIIRGRQIPYRGYYFRVLKAQGPHAPGGEMSYLKARRMTGGFALVAWPATYGSSGIMTLQVGPDGVAFQKDLGPNTARGASRIGRFDPDPTWVRTEATSQ
jgi:hypothetical protein